MYIIRSNIFVPGSETAEYFSKYRIQVSVLHRPDDVEFNDTFRKIALHLHKLTGQYVVFFPMIDPPEDYLDYIQESEISDWWRYQKIFGGQFDDVLVNHLASFFDVEYAELPVLVISTSLWSGKYIVLKTKKEILEDQFNSLTELANNKENLNIPDIEEALLNCGYSEFKIISKRSRDLAQFYSYYDRPIQFANFLERLEPNLLSQAVIASNKHISTYRHRFIQESISDNYIQNVIQTALGKLIAPASIAIKFARHKQPIFPPIPFFKELEVGSKITIRSAVLVGWLFDYLTEHNLGELDFTPAAQGYWKALENEINHSLVQVERECLGMDIKNYYTLFQQDFPRIKSMVDTPKRKNLNQSVENSRKHKFLTLGDTWHVTRTMLNNEKYKKYKLQETLNNGYKVDLTELFFNGLNEIKNIRNEGSHVSPLDHSTYQRLISCVSDENVLAPLINIKKQFHFG